MDGNEQPAAFAMALPNNTKVNGNELLTAKTYSDPYKVTVVSDGGGMEKTFREAEKLRTKKKKRDRVFIPKPKFESWISEGDWVLASVVDGDNWYLDGLDHVIEWKRIDDISKSTRINRPDKVTLLLK